MTTDTIVSPDWWSTQSDRHDYSGTPDWCECGESHESVICANCEDMECPTQRARDIHYRDRIGQYLCSECLCGYAEGSLARGRE